MNDIDTSVAVNNILNDAMLARQIINGSGAVSVGWRTLEYWASALFAEIARREELEELLRDVRNSGVEFEDSRIGYVVVQIDKGTWAALHGEEKP